MLLIFQQAKPPSIKSVEADLFKRLSEFPALNAVVGDRVYPQQLSQGVAFPAVCFHRVSTNRPSTMNQDVGIARARFQFDIWADDFETAKNLTGIIQAALRRYRGKGSVEIVATFFLNEVDLYEPDTRTFHQALDFEVNYRE